MQVNDKDEQIKSLESDLDTTKKSMNDSIDQLKKDMSSDDSVKKMQEELLKITQEYQTYKVEYQKTHEQALREKDSEIEEISKKLSDS